MRLAILIGWASERGSTENCGRTSNTRQLIFDVFDQIAHLSEAMTLEPGDVVFSGTPGGVGAAMKPPVYLRDGDRVQCEIDELGTIEAVCEAE